MHKIALIGKIQGSVVFQVIRFLLFCLFCRHRREKYDNQ